MADNVYTPGGGAELPPERPIVEVRAPKVDVLRRITWAAVFGGVLTALGMELLFTLFGFFIGFKLTGGGAVTWAIAWYLVTSAWSLFFGAWVAARISGNPDRRTGILHGVVTWGLTTFATFAVMFLIAWGLIGGTIQMARAAVIAAGQAAPAAAAQAPPQARQQAQQQAGTMAQQVQQNAPMIAAQVAHQISRISLLLWGGVLLGFVAAIFGASIGAAEGDTARTLATR